MRYGSHEYDNTDYGSRRYESTMYDIPEYGDSRLESTDYGNAEYDSPDYESTEYENTNTTYGEAECGHTQIRNYGAWKRRNTVTEAHRTKAQNTEVRITFCQTTGTR